MAEQKLLASLLTSEEIRNAIIPSLEPRYYESLGTASIFREVLAINDRDQQVNFESVGKAVEQDENALRILAQLPLDQSYESFDEALEIARNCLEAIRDMALRREISELSAQIYEAGTTGNNELCDQLTMRKLMLEKEQRSLAGD